MQYLEALSSVIGILKEGDTPDYDKEIEALEALESDLIGFLEGELSADQLKETFNN